MAEARPAAPVEPVVRVALQRVAPHGDRVPLPRRMTAGAAGYDVCAAERVSLAPGRFARVRTGLRMALPHGWEAQVRPRSGLAAQHGVTVLNAPGTIDADFRGELQVLLINHGAETVEIEEGMRVAQLVFARAEAPELVEVDELPDTARGDGGYGSTGLARP